MANCKYLFCGHCKCETLFILQSDLLWYCDECDNVSGSYPKDEIDDLYCDEDFTLDDVDIIRCPECGKFINVYGLDNDYLCPDCFEDLGSELEKIGYVYNEEYDTYFKKFK